MDTSPLSSSSGGSILSGDSYARNAKVPVVREGRLNESAVRQISSGSIIGEFEGLFFSFFLFGRGVMSWKGKERDESYGF